MWPADIRDAKLVGQGRSRPKDETMTHLMLPGDPINSGRSPGRRAVMQRGVGT